MGNITSKSNQPHLLNTVLIGSLLFCGQASGGVDGDGNTDLIFANSPDTNQVCLGDGAGAFSCSDINSDIKFSQEVILVDVNGDGKLDAVIANEGCGSR